jgi:outer membrane protein OmpA-like peptidoglycan-associated protein
MKPFCLLALPLFLITLSLHAQTGELNPIPLSIRVTEEVSLKPIAKAVARIYEEDSIVGQYLTDTLGLFRMNMYPYRKWRIEVIGKNHYKQEAEVDTRDLANIKLVTNISMMPKGWYQFKGVLLDQNLEYFLPNVNMKLIDMTKKRSFYNTSNERGVYYFPLIPGHDYELWAEDDSFFRAKATMLDCSDQVKDEGGVGVFCTSGFHLQDYKFDVELGQKTLVGTMRLQKLELNKDYALNNIYYDQGKSNIRSDAAKVLDKLYVMLKQNPQIRIELSSHTDARGPADSNLGLSQRRAQAAREYLIERGIHANRITAKGYGETKLKNRCKDGVRCGEKEHAANRRTEFRVIGVD